MPACLFRTLEYVEVHLLFFLQLGEDPLDPNGMFSISGGLIYMSAGLSAILAFYKNAKIT